MFALLNINSIRNKFDSLVIIVNKNIDVFIDETKMDSPFPTAQFHIEGYKQWKHAYLYRRRYFIFIT